MVGKTSSPVFRTALDSYWGVTEPDGICRIGLRYINRIVIREKNPAVEEYLKSALPEIQDLPEKLVNFVSRIEYIYPNKTHLILSQWLGTYEEYPEVFVDLDVVWNAPESECVDRDKALKLADDLHRQETEAFEAVITDKTRGLFQ